jgi:hypothetical protein
MFTNLRYVPCSCDNIREILVMYSWPTWLIKYVT